MPLDYFLVENRLTPDPDDHFATVVPVQTLGLEDLARRISIAGTTVREADIRAVLTILAQEVREALTDGCRVQIPGVVGLFASISGVFDSAADGFDPARHTINLNAQCAPECLAYLRQNARVQKLLGVTTTPVLQMYQDLASGTTNAVLTPGTIGTILGSRLKFDLSQGDEGIFLLPTGGGAALRVPPSQVQTNKSARLIFLVPALAAGTYRMEARSRATGSTGSGSVRSGQLEAILTAP